MKSIYIYHHLGLGDHIIANGLVRTLIEDKDQAFLFCKPNNIKNVSYMYSDLKKLKIISMSDDEVKIFMRINPDNDYRIIGHHAQNHRIDREESPIDEIFYDIAQVSFHNKWDKFFIPRNEEKENLAFNKLNLNPNENYIFVHDDRDTKREITKIPSNIRIIRPDNKDIGIFEFLGVIEKAKEIHCINSSFYCLIDCIQIHPSNLFLHTYTNPGNPNLIGKYRSDWKIIN